MRGAPLLAAALADRIGVEAVTIGAPEPTLAAAWDVELAAARPAPPEMAARVDMVLADGGVPVSAIGVCSVALATVPVVARHRPDAVVVWFDAHADLNTPTTSTTGFLGGTALAGPLGLWDSGLGSGLAQDHVVLVGSRDLDPPEHELIGSGRVALVRSPTTSPNAALPSSPAGRSTPTWTATCSSPAWSRPTTACREG